MTTIYAPSVFLSKTAFMQRLADCTRQGFVHWTGGRVPLEKAQRLATKLGDFYAVGLSKDQRYRRKLEGRGNAVLLMWRQDEATDVVWFLLVTQGDHPAHTLERLQDVRRLRISVTGYELVQQTRKGSARPAWTWRMTESAYAGWRRRMIEGVRRHADMDLAQSWRTLHRAPGFAPIRVQVRKIAALARAEWKRCRSGAFPLERARIPYVSRIEHSSIPLRLMVQAAKQPAKGDA